MEEYQFHRPCPRDDVRSPEAAIQKIRRASLENLYIFKNGKQTRRFIGETNRITIQNNYLLEMKDAIIVHNHPNGAPFSREDVQAICSSNARELILVTHDFVYNIVRPESGWNIDFSDEITQQRWEESNALAEDAAMKAISRNEISVHEKDVEIIHYIWASFFLLNGVRYVRKKIT